MSAGVDLGYQRIGRFLVEFARLEAALNEALLAAVSMVDNPAAELIIQINIAKRIELLKLAIGGTRYRHGENTSDEWRANATAVVNRAFALNDNRAALAHAFLTVAPDGTLSFHWKGKPNTWDANRFDQLFGDIRNVTRSFQGMKFELEGIGLLAETGIFSLMTFPAGHRPSAGTGHFTVSGQPVNFGEPSDTVIVDTTQSAPSTIKASRP